MKVTLRHEAANNKNQSITEVYNIDPGEFALMVETDRVQRAQATGQRIAEVKARDPQKILDEMWRVEEACAHKKHRTDRNTGAELSYDQLEEIDRDPADHRLTPEEQVIADEDARAHQARLDALRRAVADLDGQLAQVAELTLAGMSQAQIARHLGYTRARISQLFRQLKTVLRSAIESDEQFNSSPATGSGVRGEANRATPTRPQEGGHE